MKGSVLVSSPEQAVENILRYQMAIKDEQRGAELTSLMSQAHAWYAFRPEGERWLFAPSKFVGYVDNTAAAYLRERDARDGGKTENTLQMWFHPIDHDTGLAVSLGRALCRFLQRHGHSGPRKDARICLLTEVLHEVCSVPETMGRIVVDPSICAGRPYIRNTRVRVSDILHLMASGVTSDEILDDYPYLDEEDLREALAWAADTVDHRVIRPPEPCAF